MGDIANLFIGNVDYRKYVEETNDTDNKDIIAFRDDYLAYKKIRKINNGQVFPWTKSHEKVWLNDGELTVWHGFTGHMKTQVCLQLALGLVQQGVKVHVASMELTPMELAGRLTALASGYQDTSDKYDSALFDYLAGKLFIYDRVDNVSHEEIQGMITHSAKVLGTKHIIIDNLMTCGTSATDYEDQSRFVKKLSALAKKYSIHIHLVAHAKKPESSKSSNPMPNSMYSISGSSNIANIANRIISVWYDKQKKVYMEQGFPPDMEKSEVDKIKKAPDILLNVQKNRSRPYFEGYIGLWLVGGQVTEFNGKRLSFDIGFKG